MVALVVVVAVGVVVDVDVVEEVEVVGEVEVVEEASKDQLYLVFKLMSLLTFLVLIH